MARTPNTPKQPAQEVELLPASVKRIEEAQTATALALSESHSRAVAIAEQLGYEGSLTVGTLEDEIRFYQRRTVEALLETGKRLLLLKEIAPHGEFEQRVELLGFSTRTAQRFMQAASKTAKSANLALLSGQVKNASAFLELVTHDEDTLSNLAEMDDIDRMSPGQLREALRQSKQDSDYAGEQLEKERARADTAEKKLRGKVPEVVPLDERISPFQKEIAERQDLTEKAIAAHIEATDALDAWWTDEVTSRPDYDPTKPVEMPKAIRLVLMNLVDSGERLAGLVGALQHALESRFGADIAEARQYLMQEPAEADAAHA